MVFGCSPYGADRARPAKTATLPNILFRPIVKNCEKGNLALFGGIMWSSWWRTSRLTGPGSENWEIDLAKT